MEGDSVEGPIAPPLMRVAAQAGAAALSTPSLYQAGVQAARLAQAPLLRDGWVPSLPPPLNRWTAVRPFPALQGGFREWWGRREIRGTRRMRREHTTLVWLIAGAAAIAIVLGWARRRAR
jgi:Domain of unknown function (DUF3390)